MISNPFNRKNKEKEVAGQNRLPPGQSLTERFPVLHYGPTPRYPNLDNWDFKVFGLVEEERVWNWAEFNKLPRTDVTLDIHCVTRWSKFDTLWSGVSFKTLIEEGFIQPLPEAKFVVQHCEHDYTTNTSLDFLMQDNVLLATHYNGQPLEPDHGYPLRVVVGSFADRGEKETKYFWKGGKWLRGLEFRASDAPGFWEQNGYSNEADPWREQRFSYGW